jgi:hypothetical protein
VVWLWPPVEPAGPTIPVGVPVETTWASAVCPLDGWATGVLVAAGAVGRGVGLDVEAGCVGDRWAVGRGVGGVVLVGRGWIVGAMVGLAVGRSVGVEVGRAVGDGLCTRGVAAYVGTAVGARVGASVGTGVEVGGAAVAVAGGAVFEGTACACAVRVSCA